MGFLKKFFRNVFRDDVAESFPSSFEHLSEEQLGSHLQVKRYGNFELTDAVRPSFDLRIVPTAGYRHDVYQDDENRNRVPVIMAAVSSEDLFDLFMDMLDPLGPVVDVVIETSHEKRAPGHVDLYREHIDTPVLKSILWEYEDMLLNDGCTGIAVLNPHIPQEVQFDEHKLLIAYGTDLAPYEEILQDRRLPLAEDIQFITEAEHVHSTSEKHAEQFQELRMRLGVDGYM